MPTLPKTKSPTTLSPPRTSLTSDPRLRKQPQLVESSLPDTIPASFYTPGQRLSLDDIAALLAYNDANVLSVLKLRTEHNAPIRNPRNGWVEDLLRMSGLSGILTSVGVLVFFRAALNSSSCRRQPSPGQPPRTMLPCCMLQSLTQSLIPLCCQGDIKAMAEASAATTAYHCWS
eukprot:jgi/Mesvir1/2918/Mv13988-RA.1